MPTSDQPPLQCIACGYSLRGIEPLPPKLTLRCPECGRTTTLNEIASHFQQRGVRMQALPKMFAVAAPAAILVVYVLDAALQQAFLRDSAALTFAFAYGCLISGILTIPWHHAPWWGRVAAIGIAGVIDLFATAYVGIRFGTLPMLVWCLVAHLQARRLGWT